MLPGDLESAVLAFLRERFGKGLRLLSADPISGGCIHNGRHLQTSEGDFFLKYNHLRELANFETEIHGLGLLAGSETLGVPKPFGTGTTGAHAFLLMEYVQSAGRGARFWEDFGEGLAAMHRQSAAAFGLERSNFIGRLPQSNGWRKGWVEFFVEERLEPQLVMAERDGRASKDLRRQFEALYVRLGELMPEEPPSLLHGDLWSGNFMVGSQGNAVVFDPAVFYGHREAEIAFTRLFGGFSGAFYAAYLNAWPLQPGWEERIDLFNLYPLTVHLNLFGSGYLPEIQSILRRFA